METIKLATAQVYSKEQSYEEILDSIYTSGRSIDDVFFPVEGQNPEEILQHVLTLTLDALVGAGYGTRQDIIKQCVKHYFTWDEFGNEMKFQEIAPVEDDIGFVITTNPPKYTTM